VGIMQSAYDAMDALDVPVPDGIDELRSAVAALRDADLEPGSSARLRTGFDFPRCKSLGFQGLGEAGEVRRLR